MSERLFNKGILTFDVTGRQIYGTIEQDTKNAVKTTLSSKQCIARRISALHGCTDFHSALRLTNPNRSEEKGKYNRT